MRDATKGSLLSAALAGSGVAAAHEKWLFEGQRPPLALTSAFAPPNLFFVVFALFVTGVAYLWWRQHR